MSILVEIPVTLLSFRSEEKARWVAGDRSDCTDPYARSPERKASTCFGEYIAGRHYERQGWNWIHHDFDLFGTNKANKYPKSERVLSEYLGPRVLAASRTLYQTLKPFTEGGGGAMEQPDLLVYHESRRELRFVECKRTDTRDKVNQKQIVGLFQIAALLDCQVDFCVIHPEEKVPPSDPIRFELPVSE